MSSYDWCRRRWWHLAWLLSGLCATSLPFLYSLGKTRGFAMDRGLGLLFPPKWV